MSFDPLTALFEAGKLAIERIWPDPNKRAEELRKLEELRATGDLANLDAHVKIVLAQLEVNKKEAQHKSIFVAGWRPFIGWAGGFSLVYAGIVYPLLLWVWAILQATGKVPSEMTPPPQLESGILGSIITGMLGVGGMRSFDKAKGTETNKIK